MRPCLRPESGRLAPALWLTLAASFVSPVPAVGSQPARADHASIRAPTGPADVPQFLPGRWIASLCISADNCHAWIRLQHVETGEVRSISRYHVLVGGWFEARQLRWHYLPAFRTGLHMDREQKREFQADQRDFILLSAVVTNPSLHAGNSPFGHGVVRYNCVTYTRDAWYQLTGEYFELPPVHTPRGLRAAVEKAHPETAARRVPEWRERHAGPPR